MRDRMPFLSRRWRRLKHLTRRQLSIAVPYFVIGMAMLVFAFSQSRFPDWGLWAVFVAAFILLEWNAVEVNDRQFYSSSVMVALTAGTIFAIRPDTDALLAVALMAALGGVLPVDLKERRWFQPLTNVGQLALSGGIAGWILDTLLGGIEDVSTDHLVQIALAGAAATIAYTAVNNLLVARAVKVVYRTFDLNPWSHLPTLLGTQAVMGLLGGLLGAAYLIAGKPSILALILVVYVIGHLSLAAFAQLREAHLSTLRGFVKTLEAKDIYTRGHTERVAHFAHIIGEQMGFSGTQQEQVKWAALIHDLGKLAVPTELIRKPGRLSDDEYAEMQAHAQLVEEILAEVDFLQPMVEIASGHHSRFDGGGYGGIGHNEGEQPSLEASIVAAADAFDAMTSARSYRMALSQQWAIEELRRHSGGQFHPKVVEAFVKALAKQRRGWGVAHVNDEEMARRMAEQRAVTFRE